MRPKVWTEVSLHPEALARLQAATDVIVDATPADLPGADAAIIGAATVDSAFLDHAGPSLKMVIRHGIGYNAVDVPAASARGILAANTPDGPTISTAEHTVGLIVTVAKRLVLHNRIMRENRAYHRVAIRGTELQDQLLGVIGFGRIGRRVAESCVLGFRMRALVFDPFLSQIPPLHEGISMANSLDELLSQVDFLTIHAPLMPETHHLIGRRELRLMKPGAYLINASRGPVVDEAALIEALQEGHLAGAGLDVFDPEPPAPDNPLLHMDNVVVTPHLAANTVQSSRRCSHSVADQILQMLAGEQPTFLLNPTVWPGRAASTGQPK
jgi:D-3-phosphoglycerate dehydrogenase / 2-oxoglutarate reductase